MDCARSTCWSEFRAQSRLSGEPTGFSAESAKKRAGESRCRSMQIDLKAPSADNFDQSKRLVEMNVAMREVQASEAKIHLPSLLDEVERGETLIITRHGRPIARIVPEKLGRQAEIDRAIEQIKALRGRTGKITLQELLSARDAGRKG